MFSLICLHFNCGDHLGRIATKIKCDKNIEFPDEDSKWWDVMLNHFLDWGFRSKTNRILSHGDRTSYEISEWKRKRFHKQLSFKSGQKTVHFTSFVTLSTVQYCVESVGFSFDRVIFLSHFKQREKECGKWEGWNPVRTQLGGGHKTRNLGCGFDTRVSRERRFSEFSLYSIIRISSFILRNERPV